MPALMAGLEVQGSKSQKALEGLSVILSVRPGSFASMVPRLSAAPLTRARVLALSELAGKAGAAADAHVPRVLPQLLTAAGEEGDADLAAACQQGEPCGAATTTTPTLNAPPTALSNSSTHQCSCSCRKHPTSGTTPSSAAVRDTRSVDAKSQQLRRSSSPPQPPTTSRCFRRTSRRSP